LKSLRQKGSISGYKGKGGDKEKEECHDCYKQCGQIVGRKENLALFRFENGTFFTEDLVTLRDICEEHHEED